MSTLADQYENSVKMARELGMPLPVRPTKLRSMRGESGDTPKPGSGKKATKAWDITSPGDLAGKVAAQSPSSQFAQWVRDNMQYQPVVEIAGRPVSVLSSTEDMISARDLGFEGEPGKPAPLGVPLRAITPEIRQVAQSIYDQMPESARGAFEQRKEANTAQTLQVILSSDDPEVTPEVRQQAMRELRALRRQTSQDLAAQNEEKAWASRGKWTKEG
jgi:hypothetical protein